MAIRGGGMTRLPPPGIIEGEAWPNWPPLDQPLYGKLVLCAADRVSSSDWHHGEPRRHRGKHRPRDSRQSTP